MNADLWSYFSSALDSVGKELLYQDVINPLKQAASKINNAQDPGRTYRRRDLDEVEDLEARELFGREYDLLDERDTLNFNGEDFFERDLEAELDELFGREYDLLD